MDNQERVRVTGAVVLWRAGPVVCTCTHQPNLEIEIRLFTDGHETELAVFTDVNAATDCALAHMRTHQSSKPSAFSAATISSFMPSDNVTRDRR